MAVISVRLNSEEERIVNYLVDYFAEDKSTLIKHSLLELYEDLRDREVIEALERKERRGRKPTFFSSAEARKALK